MAKKRTIRSVLLKHQKHINYLTVAEIAAKSGYSKSAVRGAGGTIPGFKPITTKHPWHLVDWRLANVDICVVWNIPYIQVAMFRMRNNMRASMFDMRSKKCRTKNHAQLFNGQVAEVATFEKRRAEALKKELK